MEKLKFETPDMTSENIEKIAALFPNCVTEMRDENGKPKCGINFQMLRQMLSFDVVDGDECYEFTWVGKKASIVEANKPIRKTLRPCPEESKNWDSTENLYIEGDNLDVLKLLQESYLGKVKLIYIDPPYNTGNDFIYADDFMRSQDEENKQMGMYDEDENRLFKNTDSNGKFHSDWCSMMYSRMLLARNLLADDGVIFISIDDNEQENLKKICDEVFGGINFVVQIPYVKRVSPANDSKWYSGDHEYILVYAASKELWHPQKTERTEEHNQYYKNPDNDPRGPWNSAAYTCNKSRSQRPNLYYAIVNPNTGEEIWPDENAVWAYSKETHEENVKENLLYWGADGKSRSPRKKKFLYEAEKVVPRSYWHYSEVGSTQTATTDLRELFDGASFSYPKPVKLLKKIIYQATKGNGIILDFFSGSATTAHAVMQLNAEDGGHRKFIMVQLPEPCDEKSEAYKAGYKNICEIGKERIRRAGEKIKAESPLTTQDLDIGFRVLKLDDSNMKDVYYAADDYEQGNLMDMISNIKEDRIDLDLLFGCLLDWGLPLSMPYKSEQIDGCTVHTYNDGDLIACFDANVSEDVVKEIARRKPLRAVFRDSSFADSPSKINVFEIFKLYMPEDANDISNRVRVI